MSGVRRCAAILLAAASAFAELRVGRAALDDASIKALTLDDGETRAALVTCDAPAIDEATVKAVRKLLAPTFPEANVMIAATGVMKPPRTPAAARIAEAVRQASGNAQSASAWAGSGKEEATAYYNRFLMKDGSIRADPGRGNADIVQPAGEADPDLVVAMLESAAGHPLAIFGSFSMRAGALDYPSVVSRTLGKLYGPETVILWSTGAGANVSHVDVRSQTPPQNSATEARRVGMVLAGETVKACARAEKTAAAKLGVARETVKLQPLRAGKPAIDVEVQVIVMGSTIAWVGLPGELWTEVGSAIRKASPYPMTLLVGLANGSAGVLPARKGYSTGELEDGVRAAAGSGEVVADLAVRLLTAARRLAVRP